MRKFALSLAALALGASSFALTYTGSGFTSANYVDDGTGVLQAYGTTTVSGTGLKLASIDSVTLTGFIHNTSGNIDAFLLNNTTGAAVDLFSPPDAYTANFNGTYTFSVNAALSTVDSALAGKATSYNLPSGAYAASEYGGGTALGARSDWSTYVSAVDASNNPIYSPVAGTAVDGAWYLVVDDYSGSTTSVRNSALTSFSFNVTPQAVPEPTTIAALGLGSLAVLRRRKKA